MSTQYTPGPWIWGPNARLYADASLPECQRVRNVQIGKTTALCWDIKDARLIAAAPDLLSVLRWWMDQIQNDGCDDTGKLLDDMTDKTRAAIAKAEGKQL